MNQTDTNIGASSTENKAGTAQGCSTLLGWPH